MSCVSPLPCVPGRHPVVRDVGAYPCHRHAQVSCVTVFPADVLRCTHCDTLSCRLAIAAGRVRRVSAFPLGGHCTPCTPCSTPSWVLATVRDDSALPLRCVDTSSPSLSGPINCYWLFGALFTNDLKRLFDVPRITFILAVSRKHRVVYKSRDSSKQLRWVGWRFLGDGVGYNFSRWAPCRLVSCG